MGIPGYMAMTPARIRSLPRLPGKIAWMSCRFGDNGLRWLPRRLPEGSLLILDDGGSGVPADPDTILDQLRETHQALSLSGILLDFQKPPDPALGALAARLQQELPCPVAVSQSYGAYTQGPVFLDLIPAHESLASHAKPFSGRELWLELGPAAETVTVTAEGARFRPARFPLPPCPQADLHLLCHYELVLSGTQAVFTLVRRQEDLQALLREAGDLGVTRYVGLYGDLPALL